VTSKPKQKLRLKRFDAVGIVDRGANPHAHILLYKRDDATRDEPDHRRTG
jgi:hypothetical protein